MRQTNARYATTMAMTQCDTQTRVIVTYIRPTYERRSARRAALGAWGAWLVLLALVCVLSFVRVCLRVCSRE